MMQNPSLRISALVTFKWGHYYAKNRLLEEFDLRRKPAIVVSIMLLVLLLSTAASILFPSNQSSFNFIKVDPKGEFTNAQYQDRDPFIISSNLDFVALGASGVGTPSDPYTFENLQIADPESCILIRNTTAYFVILNCYLESGNTDSTIIFENVENGRVEQCKIVGGSSGIELSNTQDCIIEENIIYDGWMGIFLHYTSTCTVINNRIHDNDKGIVFTQSDYCVILNNTIYSNQRHGIEIAFDSYNNSVYGNSIGWNDAGGFEDENAFDSGENNTFDDGVDIGNLWSDYNGSEIYVVPGGAGSTDQFAQLLEDTVNPGVLSLTDIAIDVDSIGNELTWTVYDLYPSYYVIEQDEQQIVRATWEGREVSYGLDHLQVGAHSITLILIDGAGNTASDGVFVTVISFILGGIGTEFVMFASGITVACFVIIVIFIKKVT